MQRAVTHVRTLIRHVVGVSLERGCDSSRAAPRPDPDRWRAGAVSDAAIQVRGSQSSRRRFTATAAKRPVIKRRAGGRCPTSDVLLRSRMSRRGSKAPLRVLAGAVLAHCSRWLGRCGENVGRGGQEKQRGFASDDQAAVVQCGVSSPARQRSERVSRVRNAVSQNLCNGDDAVDRSAGGGSRTLVESCSAFSKAAQRRSPRRVDEQASRRWLRGGDGRWSGGWMCWLATLRTKSRLLKVGFHLMKRNSPRSAK